MLHTKELNQILAKNASALAEMIVKAESAEKKLTPPEVSQKKIQTELESNAHSLQKEMSHGLKVIIDALGQCQGQPMSVEALIEELSNCFAKIRDSGDVSQFGQCLLVEKSWKTHLGISDNCIITLYQGAKSLFEVKDYRGSEKAFFVICALDPTQYAHWIGLGHSSFHEANYAQAINSYSMASSLDPENVWPHIWAANTFEKMRDFQYCKMALGNALDLLRSIQPSNQELLQRLESRMEKLSNLS